VETKTNSLHTKNSSMKKHTITPQIFKAIYLIIVIVLSTIYVHAQSDPGDLGNAPIDGGLSLLLAAGVGYGAKKLREKKKQQQEEENK
jgi:hypothetical protein